MKIEYGKLVTELKQQPSFLGAVMRPCPFCGSNDLHFFEEPSKDKTVTWHRIQHSATNPCSISMINSNKENLIRMWNAIPTLNKPG